MSSSKYVKPIFPICKGLQYRYMCPKVKPLLQYFYISCQMLPLRKLFYLLLKILLNCINLEGNTSFLNIKVERFKDLQRLDLKFSETSGNSALTPMGCEASVTALSQRELHSACFWDIEALCSASVFFSPCDCVASLTDYTTCFALCAFILLNRVSFQLQPLWPRRSCFVRRAGELYF